MYNAPPPIPCTPLSRRSDITSTQLSIPISNFLPEPHSALLRSLTWRNSECRSHESIRVIRTRLAPQQRLLPRLIRIMPPHQITVFFRRQERNEVDSRPHLFACELTVDQNNQHRNPNQTRISPFSRLPSSTLPQLSPYGFMLEHDADKFGILV